MQRNGAKDHGKVNLGIELLRSLLCLWVVIVHCTSIKKEHMKYLGRGFHVPTFFMLSFYFYYPILNQRRINKIKIRFQRLLFPYIFYSLSVFVLNNILVNKTSFGKEKEKLYFSDLYLQLLTGSRYYRIFWFQFNLIYLTFFFTILSFTLKNHSLFSFEILAIISLYLLFQKTNFNFFNSSELHIKMSLGRLNSSIPLGVLGCVFGSKNLLLRINNLNKQNYLILLSLVYILIKYDLFVMYPGFLYSNTLLFLISTTILFIIFGSFKFDNHPIFNKFIKSSTRFTGGIYYIHQIFPKYIYFFINKKKASYFDSFIIYIICYYFCFIGNKLFKNIKIKYLFT